MFVTAVCFLFLLKLKWPKNKNIYDNKTCRSLTGEDKISHKGRSNDLDKLVESTENVQRVTKISFLVSSIAVKKIDHMQTVIAPTVMASKR